MILPRNRRSFGVRLLVTALVVVCAVWRFGGRPAFAQTTTGPKTPPLVIASLYGRDLFEFYCAPCHGRDGKGRGPVASALTVRPADLTTISARNAGRFPTEHITAYVTGNSTRPITSHGSTEMPVWGPIFRSLDSNDAMARERVSNIVQYIQSLQPR